MYDYYKQILDEHKNDYLFLTRLRITDCLSEYDFTKEQLNNLIVNISNYWLDGNFDDNDLYSIISIVEDNKEFAELDFEKFCEELDKFTDTHYFLER